ncbi:DUF6 domain protein, putative [Talaromyces stipitatus ATCC 10500]|uniref:DUF6 domain protein, putative n=1 Tax=Talaromyces stipitatus (strain ATCC 10500 / CBS 375.48 / QM 6759 / NRRL 1006) TaxID=441959 RepID=B8LVD5_TALSN|nr:DUF6 domain protein, putative [Talaromyces stipitatus ATCC 10500]EED23954.1 DUF6 domain protein, putative [Talaromyces stipitatus ATCC 10500]
MKMGDVSQSDESAHPKIRQGELASTTEIEVNRTETISKPDEPLQYGEPASTYLDSTGPAADTLFGDNLSLCAGNVSNGQTYGQIPLQTRLSSTPEAQLASDPSQPVSRWKRSVVYRAWAQSKGMLMVILSQFFGSSMNVMTQLLERDGSHGKAMHPFQILFTRMIITVTASFFYMWYTKVPNPFGSRGIRGLLALRASGGFFGVFGMYFSLLYMPLSEATVLTFLSPIVACYACSFLMPNEPFTRKQQLAGLISLLGVVLIARPFSGGKIESLVTEISPLAGDGGNSTLTETVGGELSDNDMADGVSAIHHLMAVGFGIVGVFGAACAYVTIRLIGPRAHPLVSVTYFSGYTATVSLIAMIAIPSVSFRLPGNLTEWALLLGLGATGFTMQYLLTAGLAYQPPAIGGKQAQKGNGTRATSMLYTQMLFALFYDKVVMDSSPSAISWAGSGLILGSALYVGVVRDNSSNNNTARSAAQDNAQGQGRVSEDRTQTGPVKDTISSADIRDVEEGRGLLTGSDDIDAEVEASSSSSS